MRCIGIIDINRWSLLLEIESIKTTSMEDVSTRVLEKNKEYLKPKNDLMYQDIYNCICQNIKK